MSNDQIRTQIHALAAYCRHSLQRRILVLSGREEWCFKHIKDLAWNDSLAVSDNSALSYMNSHAPDKLHLLLGREYEGIVLLV